ncbi:cysteine hydrolase [Phyllobacterium salinisoli]|uniref:Cysteine hydrolase n=1 Tax=Phyllobacterium salinisoli TaxID=1899321 RepID=A0A368K849_9HYPH|nr:isochorismatase family cysteine hydrolase [Phyllobacterium salinisoli]RCS25529.1 cysteine hydrolase [Phyllobacterium salinisoli]
MDTALVCLDYIIDIMHPDGKIARTAEQAAKRDIIAKANRALAIAGDKGWLRILVKVGFAPGYTDQPKHSPLFGRVDELGALALGSHGTEFHPDLDAASADLVIVKPRVDAFYGTNLDAALRARRIERLVVCGVNSVWAVESTVRSAHDRDYAVFILEDACASVDEAQHRSAMERLAAIAKIITVDDLARL